MFQDFYDLKRKKSYHFLLFSSFFTHDPRSDGENIVGFWYSHASSLLKTKHFDKKFDQKVTNFSLAIVFHLPILRLCRKTTFAGISMKSMLIPANVVFLHQPIYLYPISVSYMCILYLCAIFFFTYYIRLSRGDLLFLPQSKYLFPIRLVKSWPCCQNSICRCHKLMQDWTLSLSPQRPLSLSLFLSLSLSPFLLISIPSSLHPNYFHVCVSRQSLRVWVGGISLFKVVW